MKRSEVMIGDVAKVLENRPRDQVATRADISGSMGNPETSSWQIAMELIRQLQADGHSPSHMAVMCSVTGSSGGFPCSKHVLTTFGPI